MILEGNIDGFLKGSIETIGKNPVINELNVSENGTYTTPSGIDGYNPVIVNVPIPILDEITITSNGTYTPATELEGYNKINVNVPLPDNGYILNTGSGASVSYNNGVALNLQNLEVNIEAVQSGSGAPSPTNVRPISGFTEANIVVSPTEDTEDGTTYNIQFKDGDNTLTVYGGTLDVVSGKLVVDRTYFEISNFDTWLYQEYSNFKALYNYLNDLGYPPIKNTSDRKVISDKFKYSYEGAYQPFGVFSIYSSGVVYFWNNDNVYSNKNEMITAMNSIKPTICYELATPQVIQLTPTQIKTLLGNNVITADTGSINNIEYFAK